MAGESMRLQANAGTVQTLVPGRRPIDLVAYYPLQVDYYPECELQTKRWFVENVQSDWVMFDVGANIGYYSILFSQLAPAGRIYAFEPTATFSMLQENLEYNGCRNVTASQVAIGRVSGAVEDSIFRIWGAEPERQIYDFSTVDDLVLKLDLTRLDCIKIDVDSFDFDALAGAEKTLGRFNPWIVVELCHALSRRNQSAPQALEWLAGRGYRKAHVLEYENYVLHRDPDDGALPGKSSMLLTFEDRPIFLPPVWVRQAPIENLFDTEPVAHNQGRIVADDIRKPLLIDVPGPRWAYGCSWRRGDNMQIDQPFLVELNMQVDGGTVGLGCVSDDFSEYATKEVQINPRSEVQTISFCVDNPAAARHLVLRNIDASAKRAGVAIHSVNCFTAIKNPLFCKN